MSVRSVLLLALAFTLPVTPGCNLHDLFVTDPDVDGDNTNGGNGGNATDPGGNTGGGCTEYTWYGDADSDGHGNDNAPTVSSCAALDGYASAGGDCDDQNASVNPRATEACNTIDDDCDGGVDENVIPTWNLDADGDGYGGTTTYAACEPPPGYVGNAEDCDDTESSINPAASETCNGQDDNCDGTADEGVENVYYADGDADGYGDGSSTRDACSQPAGYVVNNDDCADTDASINPGATEVCDTLDNDCDGTVDEDDASDAPTWYTDADGDGYGDPSVTDVACTMPVGYTSDSTDCDDTDSDVNRAATEICNGIDDNCDGSIDPASSADATTWYGDTDADGYGEASDRTVACDAPRGYTALAGDCDDTTADVSPADPEECDAIDNDCDGSIDEAGADGETTWYADSDGDGYGSSTSSRDACTQPANYVPVGGDCDTTDASINPAATETCNEIDDNCDGAIDEAGADGETTWYADDDSDGYGDPAVSVDACDPPVDYSFDATDCDDGDDDNYPGSPEVADGEDNDCDGNIDDGTAASDDDSDGYTEDGGDCDDGNGDVSPAAIEVCDFVDNDCDGTVDEDEAIDVTTWYADADGDGYGSTVSVDQCSMPPGFASLSGDCDDGNVAYNPAAPEVDCTDPNDYNCDGSVGFADDDGDGFAACDECDDLDGDINPDAAEICNGLDDDCDGSVDIGASDDSTWYADDDSDTYGDPTVSVDACEAPANYVVDDNDCDDNDNDNRPDGTETCDDGEDNDCDGAIDSADVSDCPVEADTADTGP
ncbi:MAG: putative metal-binding motif-containing protein [Patescibacteria group bacterium]